MFRRVLYDEWHAVVPIVAFILTFGVFIYFVVRALRMKRNQADYMAGLPLHKDGQPAEKEESHEQGIGRE